MQEAGVVARRWFEEVWNERRDDLIEEMMTADSVGNIEGGQVHGREAFRAHRAVFLDAVPDVRLEVEDVLSEGDRAAVRWHATGTHSGGGFGFPATNRRVDARGTTWLIVRGGRIVEGWDTWNLHGLMNALQAPV